MKKSKMSIDMIIYLALGITVLLVMAVLIPRLLGKEGKETESNLNGGDDYDGDNVPNFFDKCKCKFAETDNGCPEQAPADPCKDCPAC